MAEGWAGFGHGHAIWGDDPSTATNHTGLKRTFLIIPYWSFVVPLTAISAWLLLSTPRKPNQKSPEPAKVIGA